MDFMGTPVLGPVQTKAAAVLVIFTDQLPVQPGLCPSKACLTTTLTGGILPTAAGHPTLMLLDCFFVLMSQSAITLS